MKRISRLVLRIAAVLAFARLPEPPPVSRGENEATLHFRRETLRRDWAPPKR